MRRRQFGRGYVVEGIAAAVFKVLVSVARHGGGARDQAQQGRVGTEVNNRAKNGQVGEAIGRSRAHQVSRFETRQAVDEVEAVNLLEVVDVGGSDVAHGRDRKKLTVHTNPVEAQVVVLHVQ